MDDEGEVIIGLRKLRNNIAFAILVANGLLVLIIYLLQNNKDILSVPVTPYGKEKKAFPGYSA